MINFANDMTEQALQQYLIKQYPKEDEGSPSMERQGRAASGNQIRHCTYIAKDCGADGNGRTCRLLMNLLQWEFDVLPTKVIKEDKAEYIQALIDTRESENLNVFLNCMTRHHCQHLQTDIDQFIKSTNGKVVDKQDLKQKMVDKWSIKPSLAEKMVDILEFVADKDLITTEEIVSHFGFNPTTAKRYLRQLTEFDYLEAHGGIRIGHIVKRITGRFFDPLKMAEVRGLMFDV